MFLPNTTLFDGRGVFTLLPKVQLHVSALDNSHLQVVHESLESSYTGFNMGCVQWAGAAFEGGGKWATAPGPALEGAPRFRPMSLSSYILR